MRRDSRKNNNRGNKNNSIENAVIKYVGIGVIILSIIVIGLLIYSKNLNKDIKKGSIENEEILKMMSDNKTNKANSDIGKSVEESLKEYKEIENELNETKKDIMEKQDEKKENNVNEKDMKNKENKTNEVKKENNERKVSKINEEKNEKKEKNDKNDKNDNVEKKVELEFVKPVDGEIIKEFSKDNLIYSKTLDEWTIHTGIDIKADKTTVVKSAEKGIVKTIKNDPRYGLTIVVEHENGFQTVYANLLTSEFVVENEKVEKGQSLGTVGNTGAFEIADEPHLHFEIIKDSDRVDPKIYIKN